QKFLTNPYDICVFDIMMPLKDGFTLAKEVREINSHIPIIFLTAKSLKEDVLEGLRIGADDYITKPFSMEELLLRIQAVLKRTTSYQTNSEPKAIYNLGRFRFDSVKQLLSLDNGTQKKLTTKESQLLKMLCEQKNKTLERNVALKSIWEEDSYFNARSMDVYITKLRKLLKDDPNIQIINIHGKGFKLIKPE
ncbi:MAG TPA: response regulator transcription factor, partial [Bacteroidales bacterium]|nr:response regulator transcription factor [Bacteroidales bacterium]